MTKRYYMAASDAYPTLGDYLSSVWQIPRDVITSVFES
jgi:hypothetical protein